MKRTLIYILAVGVTAFGVYLAADPGFVVTAEATARHERVTVALERISTVSAFVPKVREINYFEAEKDVGNWFWRASGHRGIKLHWSDRGVTQGKHSMEVVWKARRWGEIISMYFPEDWSRYHAFAFDVVNPQDENILLELRIGDYFDSACFDPETSRFIRRVTLRPGLNRLRFNIREAAHAINIDSERKIVRLRFFATQAHFYVDNMRLERS